METGTINGMSKQRAVNLAEVGRVAGDRAPRGAGTALPTLGGPTAMAAARLAGVTARIVEEVGPRQYERFFEGQTRLSLENGRLKVAAATRVLADLLGRRFGDQLRKAADGAAREVDFTVDRTIGSGNLPPAHSPVVGSVVSTPSNHPAILPRATPIVRQVEAPRYRFETFIVGRSNRLAYSACVRVSDDENAVPPIYLHGTCGLGKTHLLRSCAARYQEKRPGCSLRVTTGEQFTNEFIQAVRNGKVDAFRRSYRRVDLLCIDDVHFFTNKDATQAELLHTLDAVAMEGGRVVLASDEHPKEIAKLSERLVSRFLAGAVVKVDAPEPELRVKLVRHIAERRGMEIEEAAVELLSERSARSVGSLGGFGGSVREIEGMLNQVDAVARLLPELSSENGKIGLMVTRRALGLDEASKPSNSGGSGGAGTRIRRPLTAEEIVAEVCRELSVDLADFMGKGRHKRVVLARSLVSSISRKLTTMSFPEIARSMGRSNHSTIITAQKRLDRQTLEDEGRPLSAEMAGPYAGCTLREVYEGVMRKVQG